MKRILVRYKVKEGRVAENEQLVRAVYAELAETRPEGFRYVTFKLADGLSFVHLAELAGPDNPLTGCRAFAEFQRGIRERCEEPPAASDLEEIGSYRFG